MIRTANAEELDAMRVAYVDVMGEMFDGGALPEEDFWNLVRLGDNVFARRRIADHHLAEGDVFEAGSELLCAAERGDRESIRRLVTGREFVSHVDTSLNVAALLNLVFLDDSGLAEFVEGLGREDKGRALQADWLRVSAHGTGGNENHRTHGCYSPRALGNLWL